MSSLERGLLVPEKEFAPNHNLDTTPVAIAQQTGIIFELFYRGAVYDRSLGVNFLRRYTLAYLGAAEAGARNLYDLRGVPFDELDLDTLQAADHAMVVFSQLPDHITFPFIPTGFSRRAGLKPPSSRDEFSKRIRELKTGVWEVIEGEVAPNATLEAYPTTLRTFGFFWVASELPIKSRVDERKIKPMSEDRFRKLLREVH